MLKHAEIWSAIDQLAADHGFSPSGLARRAGLDPTTFNKSKRVARDGRPRWPSTESIAKILEATGAPLSTFVAYFGPAQASNGNLKRIPVIGYTQAGGQGYFDDAGYPTGTGWDELMFPEITDPHAYALEISGDSMEPVYRDGDTVIEGEVMAKQLARRGAKKVELLSLNAAHGERTINVEEISFIHRIIWASQ